MSKTEILEELPRLNADDLAEVQARLDELYGEVWLDEGELTSDEKDVLDVALIDYRNNPDAGNSWEQESAH